MLVKAVAVALVGVMLSGVGVSDEIRQWWGRDAQPIMLRRMDVNMDGAPDLVAVLSGRGYIRVSVICRYPDRQWKPWVPCGGFSVNGRPDGLEGARVVRFQTGDLDGDGQIDLAVEVAAAGGTHHLAIDRLIRTDAYVGEPALQLHAREFALWDVNEDGRIEVSARELEAAGDQPRFVSFVNDGGTWRRSHGTDGVWPAPEHRWKPLVRVPDVRGETAATAVRMLSDAGFWPGMMVPIDLGRGFREINAQRPRAGDWAVPGGRVDLALAVPVRQGVLGQWGELERVSIYGPGKRVQVQPGDPDFAGFEQELNRLLSMGAQRVRVGGPPFLYGPDHAYAPVMVEFFFRRPAAVRLRPGSEVLAVRRVAVPFTRYEHQLVFLGTPEYREAMLYQGWAPEIQMRAGKFFPAPRE